VTSDLQVHHLEEDGPVIAPIGKLVTLCPRHHGVAGRKRQ
jgi:hypothetical protein